MAASDMASLSQFLPPIYWPSRRQDRLAFERAKEAAEKAQQVLQECPEPDTFLWPQDPRSLPAGRELSLIFVKPRRVTVRDITKRAALACFES